MTHLTEEERLIIADMVRRGDPIPEEYSDKLFPTERVECELRYAGKVRDAEVIAGTMAVPLQQARAFGEPNPDWQNMLVFGDNLQVMRTLLDLKRDGLLVNSDGKPGIRLVYIDPPFATKQEFRGNQDQKAYQDRVAGAKFIEFLRERLILIRELLADDGSVYIHLDWRKVHYMKVILDEVFGEARLQNEIVWQRHDPHNDAVNRYGRIHDIILWYSASEKPIYNYKEITDHLSEAAKDEYDLALSPDGEIVEWDEDTPESYRRFKLDDCTVKGRNVDRQFTWRGAKGSRKRVWPAGSPEEMDDLVARGLTYLKSGATGERPTPLLYLKNGKGAKRCRVSFLDKREEEGQLAQDIWLNLGRMKGGSSYPTEKPELLLNRIIRASSNPGDLVLDAFAGSGTTLAVADKLNRRWIGIDCGKLSIYTIQKRLTSQGATSFSLFNAGLYDFSALKDLPWNDWRFFALSLFECTDEPHKIGGFQLDGKRQGYSVLVFNHQQQKGQRIDEETVEDIHRRIGKKVGSKFFIIAPKGVFDFQQDYMDLDGVRYFALRIPYSFINELHRRGFTTIKQPSDEAEVNDVVESYGFDFIRTPDARVEVGLGSKPGSLLIEAYVHVVEFKSTALLRGAEKAEGIDSLSLVLIDTNYNGRVFDMKIVRFAHQLKAGDHKVWFSAEQLGERIMVILIDLHGNETSAVYSREAFESVDQETELASAGK